MVQTSMTLMQVVTLDHWSESLLRPVQNNLDQEWISAVCSVILFVVIGIGRYALVAVLIGMIVVMYQLLVSG